MLAVVLVSFAAGLFARSWRQAALFTAILVGLRLAWLAVVTIGVARAGAGDLAYLLGYVIMDLLISTVAMAVPVFLAAGLRRLVSGVPQPEDKTADAGPRVVDP